MAILKSVRLKQTTIELIACCILLVTMFVITNDSVTRDAVTRYHFCDQESYSCCRILRTIFLLLGLAKDLKSK